MTIFEIRNLCKYEEIGYVHLLQLLKDYAQPRNKIRSLLKSKELIRVKKGLYVFGSKAAKGPYSREHLANLICGPSAISLEYALSFYQFIPERVEEITSISMRRKKLFITPIGRFRYDFLSPQKYWYGITQISLQGRTILIASKEKALCDILLLRTPALENKKRVTRAFI